MADPLVLYEVKEQIAYIKINRPDKGNAMNPQLCGELFDIWDRFEQDPEARVALLSAAGKNFCVGLDLATVPEGLKYLSTAMPANGVKVFKPIVSVVHGWVVGSGYDLGCRGADITIAAESARFSFPEALVGVMGDMSPWNVTYMPFKIMLEFMLAAQPISAQRAYEMGLVNKVVPDAELMNEGIKMAEIIKANAPLSLKAIKYAAYKVKNGVAAQNAMEFPLWVKPQLESEDIIEGAKAFAERRKANFTGK